MSEHIDIEIDGYRADHPAMPRALWRRMQDERVMMRRVAQLGWRKPQSAKLALTRMLDDYDQERTRLAPGKFRKSSIGTMSFAPGHPIPSRKDKDRRRGHASDLVVSEQVADVPILTQRDDSLDYLIDWLEGQGWHRVS